LRSFLTATDNRKGVLLLQSQSNDRRWEIQRIAEHLPGSNLVAPSFSPQSNLLVIGRDDGMGLAVRDLERGTTLCELHGSFDSPIRGTAFLDETTLVSWSQDGFSGQWNFKEKLKDQVAL
jgi:hypothetical protein